MCLATLASRFPPIDQCLAPFGTVAVCAFLGIKYLESVWNNVCNSKMAAALHCALTTRVIHRGFIRELRIHIPWTRLQSRPIEIKFKTVEIIVTPIAHTTPHQSSSPWLHSRQSRCVGRGAVVVKRVCWWTCELHRVLFGLHCFEDVRCMPCA